MQIKRYIPSNAIQTNRILGFKKRNIIEGIVVAIGVALLINLIPFVLKIKIILMVTIGIAVIVMNAFGIKGTAISISIYNYFQYKYYLNQFSYRRLSDVTDVYQPAITKENKVRCFNENRTTQTVRKFIGQ